MSSQFLSLNRWLALARQRSQSKGFTLLELLISLIVASVVVSGLLYMVVELTKIDKREATVDQVQRDMNRAMDYLVSDLQEAVYVYKDPAQVSDQLVTDDSYPTGAVPVLAFWKIDPLDNLPKDCSKLPSDELEKLCEVLYIRQSAYTLVVYFQKADGANSNSNWPGQSRIIRYELSRYSSAGAATLTERKGYRDPTKATDKDAPFESWKVETGEKPAGFSAVLVDYVQSPTVAFNKPPLAVDEKDSCLMYGTDGTPGPDGNQPLYTVAPTTANTTTNTSFFACIRNPDPDNDIETINRTNQDVYLFLRGSTKGAGIRSFSDESSLPVLETQVLIRGVIDKNLQ